MQRLRIKRTIARVAMTLVVMLFTTASAWADSPFSGGDGSEGNPYKIATTTDLDQLATNVNGGNYYSGKYFVLVDDITYSYAGLGATESNYIAIGTSSRSFQGHFDGQNHIVSGIRIYKGGTTDADQHQGLFASISTGAEVKNVILADASITGYRRIGGIVGYMGIATVENCHVLSNVTVNVVQSNSNRQGGVVGFINNSKGTVTGCTSAATLSGDKATKCGGVVGSNYGTVSNCLYLGNTIRGGSEVGAIVGGNESKNGIVSHCYFTSITITGKSSIISSAVGANQNGDEAVTDCGLAPQDNADNSNFIRLMAARNAALTAVERATPLSTTADITLQGRTLYKDGNWNTLVLPFAVSTTSGPLAGDNVVAMTLNTQSSGLSGTTLTLNFTEATTIPAGTPFIIKWGEQVGKTGYLGTIIENPVFTGVTIDNTDCSVTSSDGNVTFKGTYSPITWSEENKSILFVGTSNTLYWPQPKEGQNPYLNAFRAYFDLGTYTAREFVLNFGDEGEVNGVKEVNATLGVNDDSWYTLNGVKLSGKPTKAGLYIHNGKKVIIK